MAKPAPVVTPERWLTITEVADLMGLKPWTIRKAIRNRELECRKRGDPHSPVIRIPWSAVEKWRRQYFELFPAV